ncbi:MAG: radical SAM protein [Myxococcota bacterium]|nr:radical SAM protein [Myxococcota bacterium]
MSRAEVLAGIAAGSPRLGPQSVHIDVTNGCNAACVTCWDHSPLLSTPRPASWKRRRLPLARFHTIVDQLVAMGSVEAVVLSGMGEPLTHPDIYDMIARVKSEGWSLTMLSNLIAADIDRLAGLGVDNLLVGVQGASPGSYTAFHPGWTERDFFTMCRYLRRLSRAGVQTRHVQVISQQTADEVVEMVRFGRMFSADRVNFKLASLAEGTEAAAITPMQRDWLLAEGIPAAEALSETLSVKTNLHLFKRQVAAGGLATAPMSEIGCFMGYVYCRITVDEEVLYCCNTAVQVGSLRTDDFETLWGGPRWQKLREHLRSGRYFAGCERCGKLEQNVKWSQRFREHAGEAAWRGVIGG